MAVVPLVHGRSFRDTQGGYKYMHLISRLHVGEISIMTAVRAVNLKELSVLLVLSEATTLATTEDSEGMTKPVTV